MRLKRTVFVAILCLILCVSLLPVSAFADQTVVIIGGKLEQEPTVVTQNTSTYQGSTVISSGNTTTVAIVADSTGKNTIVEQKSSDASSVVVMMPDGSSITPQPAQNKTSQAAQVLPIQQNTTQTVAMAPQGLVNEILKLINAQRTANGLGILGYDSKLQATADLRARESAVSFGHTRPDGSAAVTAVTVDYNVAGENLIQVTTEYATAALMVETWMASPTHKANILLADFTQTALGVYEVNGVTYVSQIFTD